MQKKLYTTTQGIGQQQGLTRMRIAPRIYDWSYIVLIEVKRALLSFIRQHVSKKRADLVVADLGCGNVPYKPLLSGVRKYIGVDVYPGPAVDIVAPIWDTTLGSQSIDIVIVTEVLEHTRYVEGAVQEIHRILKPGGYLFLSVPFLYPVHSGDDEWRFTVHGLRDLFSEGFETEIFPLGGPWSTFSQLMSAFLQSFPLGRYIFIPVFITFNILTPLLNGLTKLVVSVFKFLPDPVYQQIRFAVLESFSHQYVVIAKRK